MEWLTTVINKIIMAIPEDNNNIMIILFFLLEFSLLYLIIYNILTLFYYINSNIFNKLRNFLSRKISYKSDVLIY